MVDWDRVKTILQAQMADGCNVMDYLSDAVPNEASLKELGINTNGYGISNIREEIYNDFYSMIISAILNADPAPRLGKVKELVWEKSLWDPDRPDRPQYHARAIGKEYRVVCNDNGTWGYDGPSYHEEKDAKAAAQRDYEREILENLVEIG